MKVYALIKTLDYDSCDEVIMGIFSENRKNQIFELWINLGKECAKNNLRALSDSILQFQKNIEKNKSNPSFDTIRKWNECQISNCRRKINKINSLHSDEDYRSYYQVANGFCFEEYELDMGWQTCLHNEAS